MFQNQRFALSVKSKISEAPLVTRMRIFEVLIEGGETGVCDAGREVKFNRCDVYWILTYPAVIRISKGGSIRSSSQRYTDRETSGGLVVFGQSHIGSSSSQLILGGFDVEISYG